MRRCSFPHTARSSPVTLLPGIDDGVAAARKAAARAAVVGRVPVRRLLVALLVDIDEAVPALDTACDAGLRCRAIVRGPAAECDAERAVRRGDHGRAVRQADEAPPGGKPERLAGLAAEVRGTARDAAGVAHLSGRHEPVPADGRGAPARIELAVRVAGEHPTRKAARHTGLAAQVRTVALLAGIPGSVAARHGTSALAGSARWEALRGRGARAGTVAFLEALGYAVSANGARGERRVHLEQRARGRGRRTQRRLEHGLRIDRRLGSV